MNLKLLSELPPYMNDVPEVARAFRPFLALDDTAEDALVLRAFFSETQFVANISAPFLGEKAAVLDIPYAETLSYKKMTKRFYKTVLYRIFSAYLGIALPYGSLTGVRPTKVYRELQEETQDAVRALSDIFFVSPARAALVADVVAGQAGIYEIKKENADIYVNIPFCQTRCSYCSFPSTEVGRIKKQIPHYVEAVKAELEGILGRICAGGYQLRSVYVGGGTPTALSAEALSVALAPLKDIGVEFTVEAGRPDSITSEKLDALAALGVTRVSVNPQTFCDKTLLALGRNHTAADVYAAFAAVRNYPFDINMDLIAGLPEETEADFSASLTQALRLRPENITVHTLSLKRGAAYTLEGREKEVGGAVRRMTDYARETLKNAGYAPYYMYRQKNMADNLENVGYALAGKQCVYNIDYMEEISTTFAAGAGAMSKFVYPAENRIERKHNPKGLNEYLAQNRDA